MLYSIINAKKGEEHGFLPITHQMLAKGKKMIVNENELRLLGEDIEAAAKILGGSILTHGELLNIKNKLKDE